MNILQLIDPMIAATNPYNTMLGMSRAIDGLPQRVRRCPKSKGIFAGPVGIVPHCNIFRYFWRCKSTVLIDFTFLMSIHFPKG